MVATSTDDIEITAALAALKAAVMSLVATTAAQVGEDGDEDGFQRRIKAMRDLTLSSLSTVPGSIDAEKAKRIMERTEVHLRSIFDNITASPPDAAVRVAAFPKQEG